MRGTARVWISVMVTLTGLAAVGMVLMAVFADPDTTERTVGVVGAVLAMGGLLVSVIVLIRSTVGGSPGGRRVRGGRGSIVAGGNITGSAIGNNSKVTGPHTTPSSAGRRNADDVRAGRDGIATGGDITDSALGEGSER